ncbi:uncharacterized protein Fot_35701 [Forsythia ovata]|uniref:C2 NT-type domain-containing protein n=1 Tax=Forsythia ovata TaxID=205694 RepID=A0ABD1SND1_9LAMI
MSIKGAEGNTFQKNCVEFNLYEPRRDKTVKSQLLGTAILDLADYGVVKESLSVNAHINCKRRYRNTAQPLIFLKIQPFEKSRTSSSSRDSLTGEASMDKNHGESVSALMSEEYAEEAKVSMFTDDDISSHSSLAASSVVESIGYSSPQDKEIHSRRSFVFVYNFNANLFYSLLLLELGAEFCERYLTLGNHSVVAETARHLGNHTLVAETSRQPPVVAEASRQPHTVVAEHVKHLGNHSVVAEMLGNHRPTCS